MLRPFAGWLAWAVPAAELLVAALLVIPSTRIPGLYGSAILLFMFTVYLTVMILTDSHLPCSCSGIISGFTWRQHIVFNLVFLGLAVTGILLDKRKNKDKIAVSFAPSALCFLPYALRLQHSKIFLQDACLAGKPHCRG